MQMHIVSVDMGDRHYEVPLVGHFSRGLETLFTSFQVQLDKVFINDLHFQVKF